MKFLAALCWYLPPWTALQSCSTYRCRMREIWTSLRIFLCTHLWGQMPATCAVCTAAHTWQKSDTSKIWVVMTGGVEKQNETHTWISMPWLKHCEKNCTNMKIMIRQCGEFCNFLHFTCSLVCRASPGAQLCRFPCGCIVQMGRGSAGWVCHSWCWWPSREQRCSPQPHKHSWEKHIVFTLIQYLLV